MKFSILLFGVSIAMLLSCNQFGAKSSGSDEKGGAMGVKSVSGELVQLREGEAYLCATYIQRQEDGMNAGILQFSMDNHEVFECWAETIEGEVLTIGDKKIFLEKGSKYEIIYQFVVDREAGTNNATEDLSANHIIDIISSGGKFQGNFRYNGGNKSESQNQTETNDSIGTEDVNADKTGDYFKITQSMTGSFTEVSSGEVLKVNRLSDGSATFAYQSGNGGEWLQMKWIKSNPHEITLGFEGSNKEYVLDFSFGYWLCTNPDGTIQRFVRD